MVFASRLLLCYVGTLAVIMCVLPVASGFYEEGSAVKALNAETFKKEVEDGDQVRDRAGFCFGGCSLPTQTLMRADVDGRVLRSM